MANFDKAFVLIKNNEGLYSNDLRDSGGETVLGISRNNWPNLDLWKFVDAEKSHIDFPECLKENKQVEMLATNFYVTNFWNAVKGDQINDFDVAFAIFDFAVNAGVSRSVKLTQKALNLNADGVIGTNTLSAINNAPKELFLAEYALEKVKFYIEIVDKNPTQIKYLKGWLKRALKIG